MDKQQEKPYQKLPFIISAISAIVVVLACIVAGVAVYVMAAWVSATIFVFFIIGEFVRFFLVTKVFPPEDDVADLLDEIGIEVYDEENRVEDGEMEEEGDGEGGLESLPDSEPVEDSFLD